MSCTTFFKLKCINIFPKSQTRHFSDAVYWTLMSSPAHLRREIAQCLLTWVPGPHSASGSIRPRIDSPPWSPIRSTDHAGWPPGRAPPRDPAGGQVDSDEPSSAVASDSHLHPPPPPALLLANRVGWYEQSRARAFS